MPDKSNTHHVPASPRIVEGFIREVLKSGPMERQQLITRVRQIAPNYGYFLDRDAAVHTTKKALSSMLKAGAVVSPRIGWWGLPDDVITTGGKEISNLIHSPVPEGEGEVKDAEPELDGSGTGGERPAKLAVKRQIGDGPESVYVYYHDAHAELARRDNKSVWECKIGWTIGEPDARIIGQGALTCFPRPPIIGLVIRTHHGRDLERILHHALTFAGRRLSDGGGSEWFITSPEQVECWLGAYLKTIELFNDSELPNTQVAQSAKE